jgi:hypothetical protein
MWCLHRDKKIESVMTCAINVITGMAQYNSVVFLKEVKMGGKAEGRASVMMVGS